MHIAFVNPQGNFDAAGSYMTAHPDFGGQLVYVREVAFRLAAMGHRVDVLTRQVIDPEWPEFATAEDGYPGHPNVRVLRFACGPEQFLRKEELWPHLRAWVDRIAARYRAERAWPDLWTGHYADGGLSAALLQVQSGVPYTFSAHSLGAWKLDGLLRSCATGHANALLEADARYNFGARLAAERAAMGRAAAIVTNSSIERWMQYAHPAYVDAVDPRDERRFAVIPPGVDLGVFGAEARSPREAQVRSTISAALARDVAPERRELPAVIAWSRLDPKKNHVGLIRAFAGSPALRERANLLMIIRGLRDPLRTVPVEDAPILRTIVDEIEAADLWGSVSAFSLEGQDALAALYRWGSETGGVFCLPSEHEPFSLTLIEAMATGLAVVATSNGGPREITANGRCGLLVDPTDQHHIAEQLLRLLSDPVLRAAHGQRGRERVLKRYNWESTAQGYVRLARQIAAGKRVGDSTFPLPEFALAPASLPRVGSWRCAAEKVCEAAAAVSF